jgi:peptide deformylase
MELVTYPADVLTQRAEPVSNPESVAAYLPEMRRILRRHAGVGLAAPQVGYAARFFVTEVRPGRFHAYVNPRIIERAGRMVQSEESCLSLPGLTVCVPRYAWVTVSYSDETGMLHERKVRGLLSRAIQHEMDHLDGLLLLDLVDARRRDRYLSRLAAPSVATKEC